jgi:hypothetical protein
MALLLAVSLAASASTLLRSHQSACEHVLHSCSAAMPHHILCDEHIAHHSSPCLLCIHEIESACFRDTSQSDPDSPILRVLSC